jgi:superfamily II DNA or RNA helicase
MHVLAKILALWHREGRRCLIFTQGVAMLNIIQRYAESQDYAYLRMDGSTAVGSRQALVDQFNSNPRHFLFLLTTRVGGVGVNLIGADRVLIFDPDWNPSTDAQARERAWRLGQRRHVTIYRLVTKGTVEERIYHRQVFKGALAAIPDGQFEAGRALGLKSWQLHAAVMDSAGALWQLHDFLSIQRHRLEGRFDFRPQPILFLFASLVKDQLLDLTELAGLDDGKLAKIRAMAQF